MGRRICRWLFPLFLLGGLTAHAQSPVWAIRGAHNTVYLAESVHLLKAGNSQLPPAFERAYAAAGTIVMELDLSKLDAAAIQGWMLEHGTLKDGATLRQTLGDQRYQRVAAESQRLGLPVEVVEQYEPWVIALLLTDMQYLKLGYDPEQGVEEQLEHRAAADRKEVRGLETLEEQLGQLERLSDAQQARFLDLTLDEMRDAESQTDELLTAWRSGNTKRLADMLSDEYQTFPELYQALVTDRNKRWLPQIERYLTADHDYLVVVGALHLVGKNGLLDLLKTQGLSPQPVSASAR
jgi:uncharacterized protein